jgi:hypothetical protein
MPEERHGGVISKRTSRPCLGIHADVGMEGGKISVALHADENARDTGQRAAGQRAK